MDLPELFRISLGESFSSNLGFTGTEPTFKCRLSFPAGGFKLYQLDFARSPERKACSGRKKVEIKGAGGDTLRILTYSLFSFI